MHVSFPEPQVLLPRAERALEWLLRSMAATGERGSAHHYMPLRGWSAAYPETSGYLIETLLRGGALLQRPEAAEAAWRCADWLCSLQQSLGYYAGGMVGQTTRPSVFNTAQIIFGLGRVVEAPEAQGGLRSRCLAALERAVDWLTQGMEADGSWRIGSYVPGYVPTYYTRAVWGWLKGGATLRRAGVLSEAGWQAMRHRGRLALCFYADRMEPNGGLRHAGFGADQAAFTHTLTYCLEGFWQTARMLEVSAVLEKTRYAADQLWSVRKRHQKTAGRYDPSWQGEYGFLCPTGNAQLSAFYRQLYEDTGVQDYREAAQAFLVEILPFQTKRGALPGSVPFWGPYMRFRYPNWGVKFFLDALLPWCAAAAEVQVLKR